MQFLHNPTLSKADLARALNLPPPAISKILSNSRQIKAHEYIIMRRFFGLSIDTEAQTSRTTPFNNDPGGLHDQLQRDDTNWELPANINKNLMVTPISNLQIIKIKDKIMEPNFMVGDYVVADFSDTELSPSGAFVISDGYGTLVRYCEVKSDQFPVQIRISAQAATFQSQLVDFKDITILGRVVAKLEWI